MKRLLCTLGPAASLVLVLAIACNKPIRASSSDKKDAAVEIKIDNFTFAPATITVPVGAKVTWTNHDDIPHTVVQSDSLFKSHALDTDQQFTFTFDKAGTFQYFCSLHPKMTGQIVVK